jgi:hypothetical protein
MNILTINLNKIPYQNENTWLLFSCGKEPTHPITGSAQGWNNIEYLSSFNAAINNELSGEYYLGCGMHGLSDAFWFDLDDCFVLGEEGLILEEWAIPVIELAIRKKLYIEYSVSGHGLHIAGNCIEFENMIHSKHVYSPGDSKNGIKSKAIELFVSCKVSKCKRGLLITGNAYEKSMYNSYANLPVVSKYEILEVLKEAGASKLIQKIARSTYVIKSNYTAKDKRDGEPEKDVFQLQSSRLLTHDIVELALFDDKIRYLYNFEDILSGTFFELKNEYPCLSEQWVSSIKQVSCSENDFKLVLYLAKYSLERNALVDCLINSPRGLHQERKTKMLGNHSSDGRSYAEVTVDKALEVALPMISEILATEGDIYMSYSAGMNYMNYRYLKYQDIDDMKIMELYFKKKEGYSFFIYKQASVASALSNAYVLGKNAKNEFVKHKLFNLWYNSNHGKIVKGMTFSPSKDPLVYDEDSRNLYYNLYQGWTVKPKESDIINVWLDYVKEVICSNDEEDFDYFLNYFAHLFQKPSHHAGVALILKSDKGIGKNLILEPIQYILGSNLYFMSTKTKDLVGEFNKNVRGRLLIVANEALFAGDFASLDNLKGLIADKEISVTAKHVDSETSDNYSRVIILSNRSSVINYDPTERRYRFFNCNDDFASVRIRNNPINNEKLVRLVNIVNSEDYLPDDKRLCIELQEGLLAFFLARDISSFNPRLFEFGKNAGTIRSENNNPVSQFFFDFIVTGKFCVNPADLLNMNTIKTYYQETDDLKFHPDDLYACYKQYHKEYCNRSQMYNNNQFRNKFAELFLDGDKRTQVIRIATDKTARVWNLEARLVLAAKYNIDVESLD